MKTKHIDYSDQYWMAHKKMSHIYYAREVSVEILKWNVNAGVMVLLEFNSTFTNVTVI